MHYVYILRSAKNKRIYVGYSTDLKARLVRHNEGRVKSTKAYRPWILVYYEAYLDVHDAARREMQLKMHAAKNALLEQIKESLDVADGKIRQL